MLSRNFRLQAVGNIDWLFNNYDFATVSRGLDELMILDVSRGEKDPVEFSHQVQHISRQCFIPLTAGGGISSLEVARLYLRSGADKLLLNTAFQNAPELCKAVAGNFGRQCLIAGVDYRMVAGRRKVMVEHGGTDTGQEVADWVDKVVELGAGEILFQSIDKDGTGMGLDTGVLEELHSEPNVPCILMGGVGKSEQVILGLANPRADAVATANLFNFIGSAFLAMREELLGKSIEMANWTDEYDLLRGMFVESAGTSKKGGTPE
jgi:cyclase